MNRANLSWMRPILYYIIGSILLCIVWSLQSDSVYAYLRMKMSQLAPSNLSIEEGKMMNFESLQEAQISGVVLPKTGERYGILKCENIGLLAPIYYGDDEEILLKGVGQYPNGKIPGFGGTFLLAGHDTTYFECLLNVEEGERLELTINDMKYQYLVEKTEVMDAEEFVYEDVGEEEERLILYTCYNINASKENRKKRLFVYCTMMSEDSRIQR